MSSRAPLLLATAFGGVLVSGYLAAFQLHFVATVWDPLFGSGSSERVLTSGVSRMLPVPDGLLGAAAYALEFLLAAALVFSGGSQPRLAMALAAVASVGALTALGLALAQPLLVHAFCALCLVSAALSVGLAVGAIAEAHASTSKEAGST